MTDTITILNKLFLALQNVRFYPPTHSLVQESLAALFTLLQDEFVSGKDFSFGFVEKKLMVNGKPVNTDPAQTMDLARYFEILHVDNITIRPGLTQPELRAFLECMSIKPEQLNESGGMKKALADKGLRHIQANDVVYGRITKDNDNRKEKVKYKDKEMSAVDVNFIKALRMADKRMPAAPLPFAADRIPAPPPVADTTTPMPSPEELKELYAIRDQFKSEMDRRVQEATRHYEIENKHLALEKDKTLPVIMITAHGTAKDMEEAERLGISGFFRKDDDFSSAAKLIVIALESNKLI